MHWVSADHAVDVRVALYERLFSAEVPGETTGDVFDDLDPNSRELLDRCKAEPELAETPLGSVVQFERLGYSRARPARNRCCSTARSASETNGRTSRNARAEYGRPAEVIPRRVAESLR